jgi:hypothetical protein
MRITGNTGVKEGQDVIVNLDDKKADIFLLVLVGEELWDFLFEIGNVDNHIRSSKRRSCMASLTRA